MSANNNGWTPVLSPEQRRKARLERGAAEAAKAAKEAKEGAERMAKLAEEREAAKKKKAARIAANVEEQKRLRAEEDAAYARRAKREAARYASAEISPEQYVRELQHQLAEQKKAKEKAQMEIYERFVEMYGTKGPIVPRGFIGGAKRSRRSASRRASRKGRKGTRRA